jgi:uncharacterized protein
MWLNKKKITPIVCFMVIAITIVLVSRTIVLDKAVLELKEERYAIALRHLKLLAFVGDSKSQYLLGNMYAFGLGVKKDDAEANSWFFRAGYAQEGAIDRAAAAQYFVGERFETGRGLAGVDMKEAVKWYKLAAKGGYKPAEKRLEIIAKGGN